MTMAIPLSTLVMTFLLMAHANAAVDIYKKIKAITAKLDRLDQHIFFLASAHVSTLPSGAIAFGDVRANTGDAYNPNTGVFTAPVAGLYLFTVQTYTRAYGRAGLELRVNEQWVLRSSTGSGSDESNQFVYPVYLKARDNVYVNNTVAPCTIWNYNHTIFAGLLFKAL